MNKIIKFISKKSYQVWYVIKKVFQDIYYGIKWILLYTPKDRYTPDSPFKNHPQFEEILRVIELQKGHERCHLGIEKYGYIDTSREANKDVKITLKDKHERIKAIFDVDSSDQLIDQIQEINDIKLNKTEQKRIIKEFDLYDVNSIRTTIKDIVEKQKNKTKGKKDNVK